MAYGTGYYITDTNDEMTEEKGEMGTNFGSSFEAETEAIIRAMDRIMDEKNKTTTNDIQPKKSKNEHEKMKKVVILTDSQSVLQATASPPAWPHWGIQKLRQKLWKANQKKNLEVKLAWIPSHVGIPGNENADQLAERGLLEAKENDMDFNEIDKKFTVEPSVYMAIFKHKTKMKNKKEWKSNEQRKELETKD